jgi:hypothetical protein
MTSPRTPKASRRQKVSSKGVLNAVRTERKAELFRHGQPWPTRLDPNSDRIEIPL